MGAKSTTARVETLDDTASEKKSKSVHDKVGGTVTSEIAVFAKAASIYFDKYHELHHASEAEKKHNSLADFFTNTQKAHKAAWKHVLENSEVHQEHKRQAKRVLPDSHFDDLHKWLDDKD